MTYALSNIVYQKDLTENFHTKYKKRQI